MRVLLIICCLVVGNLYSCPTITMSKTDVSCNGGSNGQATAVVSGSNGPFKATWSNGHIVNNVTSGSNLFIGSLPSGVYTIYVVDQLGCSSINSISVEQPIEITSNYLIGDVECKGVADGSILVETLGGTGPYSYSWSNGAIGNPVQNLSGGSYTVTVTDSRGCSASPHTINVSEPASLLTASTVAINNLCNGESDGSVNLTVQGGTAPYLFNWNSNTFFSEDLSGVPSGNYQVIVTDKNNCTVSASAVVSQPTPIVTVINPIKHLTCFESNDGSLAVAASGGVAPLSYSWSTSSNQIIQNQTTINSLPAGTYISTVTDANGCEESDMITITQPTKLELTVVGSSVLCFGDVTGTVTTTVAGGTAPYTYSWNNGSTTAQLANQPAGNYQLTVTDSKGCVVTGAADITGPSSPLVSSIVSMDPMCFGENSGSIDLNVSGGTPAYQYNWNSGLSQLEDIQNAQAGTYNVVITDANGCTNSNSVTLNQPAALTLTKNKVDVLCYADLTGSIDITVQGGTPGYNYDWTDVSNQYISSMEDLQNIPAGGYIINVTDDNGCILLDTTSIVSPTKIETALNSTDVLCFGDATGDITTTISGGVAPYVYNWSNGSTTQNLASLIAGNYVLILTDANGCLAKDSITIKEPPSALSSLITSIDVTCFGGSDADIDLAVTGGVAPYSFDWNSGQFFTEDLDHISAGSYLVLITDMNGCTDTKSVTINEPTAIKVGKTVTDVLCYGGTNGAIDVSVSGGTVPYVYQWTNLSYLVVSNMEDLTNFPAGQYIVKIIDNVGCELIDTSEIKQPAQIELTLTPTHILCHGEATGEIKMNVTGGVTPYTFLWSNGATSQDITALTAGKYIVEVTDANGCIVKDSVTLSEPLAPLSFYYYVDKPTCFGASDGEIDLEMQGGTLPYSYLWDSGETVSDIFAINAGWHPFAITDGNGCVLRDSIKVDEPPPIKIQAVVTDVKCFGELNGEIDVTITGGTIGYLYYWKNTTYALSVSSEDLSALPADRYYITVRDSNYCQLTDSFDVNEPPLLKGELEVKHITCNNKNDGEIEAVITGGNVGGYTYLWSNGATTALIDSLSAAMYEVHVEDSKGCFLDLKDSIINPPPLLFHIETTTARCKDVNDGVIQSHPTGGVPPYSFIWSPDVGVDSVAIELFVGTYQLILKDANGCAKDTAIDLGYVREHCIDPPNAFTPDNDGYNDTWVIDDMEYYPEAVVKVLNSWGKTVYESVGYDAPWDGTFKGRKIPDGTYYFIIQIPDSDHVYNGPLTIIRK